MNELHTVNFQTCLFTRAFQFFLCEYFFPHSSLQTPKLVEDFAAREKNQYVGQAIVRMMYWLVLMLKLTRNHRHQQHLQWALLRQFTNQLTWKKESKKLRLYWLPTLRQPSQKIHRKKKSKNDLSVINFLKFLFRFRT